VLIVQACNPGELRSPARTGTSGPTWFEVDTGLGGTNSSEDGAAGSMLHLPSSWRQPRSRSLTRSLFTAPVAARKSPIPWLAVTAPPWSAVAVELRSNLPTNWGWD